MKLARKLLVALLALALIVCVVPAVFAAGDGSMSTPDDNVAWGGNTATIEHLTENSDVYWYTFKIPENADGTVKLTFEAYPDNGYAMDNTDLLIHAYDVKGDYSVSFNVDDNGTGAPFFAEAGDEIQIGIEAPANTFVVVNAECGLYNVVIPGTSFYACVEPGDMPANAINYAASKGMNLVGKGVTVTLVSGDPDTLKKTEVFQNEPYTDSDGDGAIEFTVTPSFFMGPVSFDIINNGSSYAIYLITITDTAQSECNHPKLATTDAIPEVGASCHNDGYAAHKICPDCGNYFDESNNPVVAEDLVIPADNKLQHDAGQTVSCLIPGIVETWYCPAHNQYYSDPEGTKVVEDRVIPAHGHHIIYVEPAEATCTTTGSTGYYWCYDSENFECCFGYFQDEAATTPADPEKVVLVTSGELHEINHAEDMLDLLDVIDKPGCTTPGKGKYTCLQCTPGGSFEMAIPATGHTLTAVAEVPATTEKEGTKAHYACDCGALFSDAEGKTEVKAADLVIPKNDNPKTGDAGIALAAVVAMVSMGAVLVIGKKKEF